MKESAYYLDSLERLISIRSVYTEESGKQRCMDFCFQELRRHLPDYSIRFDSRYNLVVSPKNFAADETHIFLSAHVDTVDADQNYWENCADPFIPKRTETHIVGRGANDCKAGVAFMLWFAYTQKNTQLKDRFTLLFSFQEEGNEEKSSEEIGKNLGSSIPISNVHNYLFCLENTTSIGDKCVTLSAYDKEPCNIFIEVVGVKSELYDFLVENEEWNIIAIEPVQKEMPQKILYDKVRHEISGHSASLKGEKNPIFQTLAKISKKQFVILKGGSFSEPSVINGIIHTGIVEWEKNDHRALINLRSFNTFDFEITKLKVFDWRPYKPLKYGQGSDLSSAKLAPNLLDAISVASDENGLMFKKEANPGRSDASAIWNTMDNLLREKFAIVTSGPGTRSHLDSTVWRKTHGENEGFHIASGIAACNVLVESMKKLVVENDLIKS